MFSFFNTVKSLFLFVFLCGPHHVSGQGLYSVAMKYELAGENANCSSVSARIHRVTLIALHQSGMDLGEDEDHWHQYTVAHHEAVEEENQLDMAQLKFNHANSNPERKLGRCKRSTCYRMCQATSQAKWCDCCACCGGRRRRRNLRTVRIWNDEDLPVLAEIAEEKAIKLLKLWHKHIHCLAKPYGVEVTIEPAEEEDEDEPELDDIEAEEEETAEGEEPEAEAAAGEPEETIEEEPSEEPAEEESPSEPEAEVPAAGPQETTEEEPLAEPAEEEEEPADDSPSETEDEYSPEPEEEEATEADEAADEESPSEAAAEEETTTEDEPLSEPEDGAAEDENTP